MTRRESRRQTKEVALPPELPPRKRGRPKRFTDEQLEAMEEEKVTKLETQKKETVAFFSGIKQAENANEEQSDKNQSNVLVSAKNNYTDKITKRKSVALTVSKYNLISNLFQPSSSTTPNQQQDLVSQYARRLRFYRLY